MTFDYAKWTFHELNMSRVIRKLVFGFPTQTYPDKTAPLEAESGGGGVGDFHYTNSYGHISHDKGKHTFSI